MEFLTVYERVKELGQVTCKDAQCGQQIPVKEATVPDNLHLYLKLYEGPVDRSRPMTAQQLADDARCRRHPLKGVRMFPLMETAAQMDRWITKNVRQMSQAHRPHHQRPQHASGPLGPIAQLLAQRKAEVIRVPKKSNRVRNSRPNTLPAPTVKRFGDEGRKNTPAISAKAAAKAAKAAKEAAKKARR